MASNLDSNSNCLLFLDYFSHANSSNPTFEEKFCDTICFNQTVQLTEARIVPFGVKIHSSATGEPTIGLTGPSQFSVEFFARISPDSGAYSPIGELRYDEKSGSTHCSLSPAFTDMIVIRGSYTTITIGLFGKIGDTAAMQAMQAQPHLPPPPQMLQQQQPAVGSLSSIGALPMPSAYGSGLQQLQPSAIRDIHQLQLQLQQRPSRGGRQFDFGFDEPSSRPWRDAIPGSSRAQPLPPSAAATAAVSGDTAAAAAAPAAAAAAAAASEVEEESEEELSDADADAGAEVADEELGFSLTFRPDCCSLKDLRFPSDPSLTAFEVEKKLLYDSAEPIINTSDETRCEESASRLAELLNKFADASTHNSEWIEQLERLPAYMPAALAFDESINLAEFETTIDTLIDWALEGLDLLAAKQRLGLSENAFIMRHLKMGINMAGILCTLSHSVNEKILPKKVQSRLLDVLNAEEYMATPLKLLILRALNNTTRLSSGADAFIGRSQRDSLHPGEGEDGEEEAEKFTEPPRVLGEDETAHLRKCLSQIELNSPYKQLVALLLRRSHTTRVMNAIANLLNKLHFYEMLLDFKALFDKFKTLERHASGGDESAEKSVPGLADKLVVFLDDIRASYTNAPQSMAQARSACLPTGSKFEVKLKPYDVYPDLYQYFSSIRLIDSLRFAICDCDKLQLPELHNLKQSACSLLQSMLSSEHGVQYLASQPIAMQAMAYSLNPDLASSSSSSSPSSPGGQQQQQQQSEDGEAEEQAGTAQPQEWISLSLQLLYKLLAAYHLDQLIVFHKLHPVIDRATLDSEQLVSTVHELYLMATSMPQGSRWMADVLLTEDSLLVLLPFMEPASAAAEAEEKKEEGGRSAKPKRPRRVTAVQKYCVSLIGCCIKFTDGAQLPQLFAACGSRLLSAAARQKSPAARDLLDWLSPVRAVPPPHDLQCFGKLVQSVKSTVDLMDTTCPPALVTQLRILRALTVPPGAFRHKEDPSLWSVQSLEPPVKELRFQFAMIELLGSNGISLLVQLINKLLQQVTPGWQRGVEFLDENFSMSLFALEPAVQLLTVLLQSAIQAVGSKFRNFSMIECLFKTFVAVCSFPSASLAPYYIRVIGRIHTAVIDSLLAFSQTALPSAGEHEKALNDSQWTCVLRKVLQLTVSAPSCFLGGLTIIGELLPLPLPVHIRTGSKVTESELSASVTLRKLVSAHLLCLDEEVGQVLQLIGGSTNPFLNQVFRRVMSQIGDLSCPTATMLAERAAKIFLAKWQPFASQLADWQRQDGDGDAVPDASSLARALNMLNIMLTVSPVKLSFLRAAAEPRPAQASVFADGPPPCARDFYAAAEQLLGVRSFSDSALRCQELIVNCLCSLLDPDITLEMPLTKSGKVKVTWQTLANSIPPMQQLQLVANAAFAHVNHPVSELATVHLCLKLLVLLAEHDAGFCLVKLCVESAHGVFLDLMKRVNTKFSKDNPDCLNTLLTALELLRTLVMTDTLEGEPMPLRSQVVSFGEVKAMLAWKSGGEADGAHEHTVFELHNLLREYVKEEASLEGLLESMDSLIEMLNQAPDGTPQETKRPTLPEPQALLTLFQRRAVFASSSGVRQEVAQERLLSDYWFGLAAPDEAEAEPELMKCDLEELAKAACGAEFNLQEELEKEASLGSACGEEAVRHKRRRHEHDAIIETSQQKRFVAPMRGRGFHLRPGGTVPMQRVNDSFRSRPPNTSRPPSMHVDDFEKLETSAQVEKLEPKEVGGLGGAVNIGMARRGGHFGRGGFGDFGQRRRFGYALVQQQQQQPRSTYGARASGRRDRCSIRPLQHK